MTLTIEPGKYTYRVYGDMGMVAELDSYDELSDYLASQLPELQAS